MNLSSELWVENQDLAQACLEHPFVQGIGNGTLKQEKFADYVGQDAFFLEAFARAYSIAAAKAPDGKLRAYLSHLVKHCRKRNFISWNTLTTYNHQSEDIAYL